MGSEEGEGLRGLLGAAMVNAGGSLVIFGKEGGSIGGLDRERVLV